MENPEPKRVQEHLASNSIAKNNHFIYNGEKDFISNAEAFICPLCSRKINENQGITLQQCLHNFCKNCLCNQIKNSVKATVQCPFLDYNCEEELLHSEIKSLVSKDIFEWHLQKSVLQYTGELLPIKKTDAVIYEYFPNTEEFPCPLCSKKIGVQKGITLQNCLHNFCLNCLSVLIERTKTPRIRCPFTKEYICPEYILDSEVRSLVSKEIYENYIQRSIYQFSRDTGENLGLNEIEYEKTALVPVNMNDKWKCKICQDINSDNMIRCGFCDAEKPPLVLQYNQLIELEESDLNLIENHNDFDCQMCLTTFGKGEGVLLRGCLHEFCKECLAGLINNSDVPEIGCPYRNDNDKYTCAEFLQDREIRSAISQEEYDKYLIKGLNLAENAIKNSYHCKTPDCTGWWINEDRVNTFVCLVCNISNCLNCQVIHTGLNCKQYQDGLNYNDQNKRTKEHLDELLRTGAAQRCPKCGIAIQKNQGCNHMICTMCKTDFQWRPI